VEEVGEAGVEKYVVADVATDPYDAPSKQHFEG